MNELSRFVATDPVTDQVLWVCSGATVEGKCPIAEQPPYACQGLRLTAVSELNGEGDSMVVQAPLPGRCPALDLR